MALDFPSSPTNGQVFSNYIYDTSLPGWRNINTSQGVTLQYASGLVPIIPSSVFVGSGSATVSTAGKVSFTSSSSISLNGTFSSAYNNYRITLNVNNASTTGVAIYIRLRSSGTDNSTNYQWITVNSYFSATRQLGGSGIAQAEVGYTGSGDYQCFSTLDISNPFLNSKTYSNMSRTYNNENTTGGWWHNVTGSFDGFTLFTSSGNVTGEVQVYGYR
jgi:hypothetical protein